MAIIGIRLPETADAEQKQLSGLIRYRANWLGQLIIQSQVKQFTSGMGWEMRWVDAKPYQLNIIEDEL